LQHLTKLTSLDIENTNFDIDIEYLPINLTKLVYTAANYSPEQVNVIDSFFNQNKLNQMYPNKSVEVMDNLYSENLQGCLYLTEYTELEELNCRNNELTSLILPQSVKKIECGGNKITNLDFSSQVKLKELRCVDNQLTHLMLPTSLQELSCSKNNLTTLDVSHCSDLTELYC
jgi:Leucine-rich repeat (LRR) protein